MFDKTVTYSSAKSIGSKAIVNKLEQGKIYKRVMFAMVSPMLNNKYILEFRWNNKTESYGANLSNEHVRFSFSNMQIPHSKSEVLWEADDGNWAAVVEMINSGVYKIYDVKAR